jgi:glycosyltransferase involved in cell wall biosynthesis
MSAPGARSPKVLHVVPSLDEAMGGSITAALGQAQQRTQAGRPTRVVSGADEHDRLDYLATDFPTVRWQTFPRSFPRARFQSRALARWLPGALADTDLVHLHGVFHAPALAVTRRAGGARVPFIVQPHGSLDPFDLAKHAGPKWLYGPTVVRRVLDRAAAILCTTTFEQDRLVTWGSSTPVHVAPLAVQPPPAADGGAFRTRHGIAPDAVVVLFLGRLDPKKGLDLLVPAVARLRSTAPALHLVVVGAGDAASTTEADALLEQPVAAGWATRLGFLTGQDKAEAWAAADVFGLVSRNENFGITVVEAAGAGLALALSDEVALASDVRAVGAGHVGPPSVEGAVAALEPLLDRGVRAEAGRRAQAFALGTCAPEPAGEALEAVYREVLDRGARLGR